MSDKITVTAEKVVGIDYTLKDDTGEVVDSSEGGEPLPYLHGRGQIVEGLEKALEGKTVGDEVEISVPPQDGYGPVDEAKQFTLPKDRFDFEVKPGDVVQAQLPNGHAVPIQVVAVAEDGGVTLDGNHPMAGKTLHFKVTIMSIRDATEDELNQIHVHDDNCEHAHDDSCEHAHDDNCDHN